MKRKEYIIEFNKLILGRNDLVFSINDAFLKEMGAVEEYRADIQAKAVVVKSETMYDVTVSLEGSAVLTCDVCLDEFTMPVEGEAGLLIRISEFERYDDDEIIYITPAAIDFDLSQFLFDSFMLMLPLKKTCSLGGKECNEDVVAKLSEMNNESAEGDDENTDDRWDKLKDIINPN